MITRFRWLFLVGVLVLGAALPARGGLKIFVHHLDGSPDGLDPVKNSSLRSARVMWAIYEPLVEPSKDSLGIVPRLAESWTTSRDGLTYTFRLRRGVVFHDGTPFNAAAVVANFQAYLKSPFYTLTLGPIFDGVKAPFACCHFSKNSPISVARSLITGRFSSGAICSRPPSATF